jgi:hypothetical protein
MAAKIIYDGTYTLVATGAAAPADADFAGRQVKVIVYNNEVIQVYTELIYKAAYRLAAAVHIGLRLG